MAEKVLQGDCLDVMPTLPAGSVNLIMTSPPYSDQRKKSYGGIHPDQYVNWFLPRAEQMKRVLTESGSLVVNIKERTHDGERHTYVHDLIRAMREAGWRWIEEYIWAKSNAMPGYWPNRLKDAFERCLHFSKAKDIKFFPDALRVAPKQSTINRQKSLRPEDASRAQSQTGSGYGANRTNDTLYSGALPSNVLCLSAEATNRGHPAVYPLGLPEFFIQLLTDRDDMVLDPFCGSGTTLVAARALHRDSIGIEASPEYCNVIKARLLNTQAYTKETLL